VAIRGTDPNQRRLITDVDLDILRDAHGFGVVPEPSTALLLGLGLAGIASLRRSSRRGS
jgi:hypothetical protein